MSLPSVGSRIVLSSLNTTLMTILPAFWRRETWIYRLLPLKSGNLLTFGLRFALGYNRRFGTIIRRVGRDDSGLNVLGIGLCVF